MRNATAIQSSQGSSQPAARSATLDAENARLDAQLELAAKKAALAGMQRAAAQGGAEGAGEGAPPAVGAEVAPVAPPGGRVVYEKDGKTIVLENPTAEQLAQVGIAAQASGPKVDGWQMVALTASVVWGMVAIVYLVLAHRRRVAGVAGGGSSSAGDARMARIENAIESVAVEVERISEAQRFTSKMLSEGAAQPVHGAGHAPEVLGAVPQRRGGGL